MSARTRVYAIVAAAAAASVAATAGAIALTRDEPKPRAKPLAGAPPLFLDLGVRTDAEARRLREALQLYARGDRDAAGAIFASFDSLEARIGAALAAWPDRSAERLRDLVDDNPRRAVARLNYGFALFWQGHRGDALREWRIARRVEPDSAAAVRADDLVHPRFPRGLPIFVTSFAPSRRVTRLPPPLAFAAIERAARTGGVRAKLEHGVALQRLGKPVSARRAFEAAVRLAPRDPEPNVALAVASFTKANPSRAFAQLGPLSRRYPRSQSVRFHLGLLLLWLADVKAARRQLALTREIDPQTRLGREANRFLNRLEGVRTD